MKYQLVSLVTIYYSEIRVTNFQSVPTLPQQYFGDGPCIIFGKTLLGPKLDPNCPKVRKCILFFVICHSVESEFGSVSRALFLLVLVYIFTFFFILALVLALLGIGEEQEK